jgi:hypothetical protein
MATQIRLRNGSSSDWSTANPVLAQGEIGLELDTYNFKIGDGSSNWNDLPYFYPPDVFNPLLLIGV